MKPTIDLLKKALEVCANAHGVEFSDWSEVDAQFGVKSESVPVVSDVRMICEAFYGNASMVEAGWGYTTVFLNECPYRDELDEATLKMALPYGTTL